MIKESFCSIKIWEINYHQSFDILFNRQSPMEKYFIENSYQIDIYLAKALSLGHNIDWWSQVDIIARLDCSYSNEWLQYFTCLSLFLSFLETIYLAKHYLATSKPKLICQSMARLKLVLLGPRSNVATSNYTNNRLHSNVRQFDSFQTKLNWDSSCLTDIQRRAGRERKNGRECE